MFSRSEKIKLFFISFLFGFSAFVWYSVYAISGADLKVDFLDVGQGDAIYIEAPGGNQIVIDGGKGDKVLSELGKVMPFFDRKIDVLIATHPDSDHVEGLVEIVKRYKVAALLVSVNADKEGPFKTLLEESENRGVKIIRASMGQSFELGRGAVLEIIFPPEGEFGFEDNSASIVSRLVYGRNSFLFTGDAPKAIENYIVSLYGDKLDSDVLKAGHHGSDTSSSEIFLAAVSPAYSVISCGEDNKYGHPRQSVLDLLKSIKSEILRTDELGAIKFSSDGNSIKIIK
jgi:competence protein ComEC